MSKFKIGDKVKCINFKGYEGAGWKKDKEVTVGKIDKSESYDDDLIWPVEGCEGIYGEALELVKPIKVNYLLKYDLGTDTVEEFETMIAVRKKIKELAKRTSLIKNSVVVYEVKKKMPVELVNSVSIKGL